MRLPKGTHYVTVNRNIVHMVDFDIVVSADFRSDPGGKFALKVAGIGGIEGKEEGAALIAVP
ncbi:MAG: hypothetical protein H0X47_01290 [Nitrospirales bacterium]|nr:hypothetical protein [Nitrospirales bacterium]